MKNHNFDDICRLSWCRGRHGRCLYREDGQTCGKPEYDTVHSLDNTDQAQPQYERQPEKRCGERAEALNVNRGEYFACILTKGHEGAHRCGGECFAHDPVEECAKGGKLLTPGAAAGQPAPRTLLCESCNEEVSYQNEAGSAMTFRHVCKAAQPQEAKR